MKKQDPKLASRMDRFKASVLDTGLMLPIFFYGYSGEPGSSIPEFSNWAIALVILLTLVVWIIQTINLTRYGQTVGKRLVKIKVVRIEKGQNGGFVTNVLIRVVLVFVIEVIPIVGQIFGLVDCFFVFRDDRRCVHDFIARTRVVKA